MLQRNYWIGVVCFLALGCNDVQKAIENAKKETPALPRENYIVLLDLSDRILYNNQQQVAKDLTVIKSIYAVFRSKLNSKDPTHLYYAVNDKLKVLIAPQKTTPKSLYDMVGNLRIELSSEQPEKKASVVDETEKMFNTTLPEIYRQAVISNNSTDYSGADIWKYFNEDLEDDLENNGQNTLFILTDGYMDFEKTEERPAQNNRFTSCAQIINNLKKNPDWSQKFDQDDYGLLPVGKKFPNLRVVLLEINPKEELNGEFNLLTRIWSKWFAEMGIRTFRFIKDDNINEVRESIEKFMDVKIAGKIEPVQWAKVSDIDSNQVVLSAASGENNTLRFSTPLIRNSKNINHSAKPLRATKEVLPPDETDADFLPAKKKDEPEVKNIPAVIEKDDGDILKDGTPKKGFNTGIKKNKKNRK